MDIVEMISPEIYKDEVNFKLKLRTHLAWCEGTEEGKDTNEDRRWSYDKSTNHDNHMTNHYTILDINYVDFLQFQLYFTPQAELEEAFIYIIHKPIDFSIDFSCRLKT